MFLCHFPFPGGSRRRGLGVTQRAARRSSDLPLRRIRAVARPAELSRLYHSARLDRAVEGLIGELIGTFVFRTWDRLNVEGHELASKLNDAVEKRLEARVTDLVPVFELANDEL
jgi:hypothetical protein